MKKTAGLAAAAALALTALAAPAASAAPAGKPDTACMQAGIATLKEVGLFSTVAKEGLPVATALSVGVTTRDKDMDISALPEALPLSVVLADHRAGDDSIFVYPWCS